MSSRTINLALLTFVGLELASGVFSLLVGNPDGRWLFWLHRVAGFAIVCLLFPKWRIVSRSYGKRGVTAATITSSLFGLLVLSSLGSGILWASTGFPGTRLPLLGSLTGLGVHIALSVTLIPLFLWHILARWPLVRGRVADFTGRRAALRYLALGGVGLAGWQIQERVTSAASLSGTTRRYSGSRERGSMQGNGFPRTNWFTDPMPRIALDDWNLRIDGSVERETVVTYRDLLERDAVTERAILDCTGGWFTEQDWTGVPLSMLLALVTPRANAQSLVIHSQTGYTRRFPIAEAPRLLLGTHVGGEPLSPGHGFPVRLVAPGYRGFNWVKWVVRIEVSDEPEWWQSPLPLQ